MHTILVILSALALVAAAGCSPSPEADAASQNVKLTAPPQEAVGANPNVVDVVATRHELQAPTEISPGWTTFRLHNESAETHFALIDHLPEDRTFEDVQGEVVPVFQEAMDLINADDPDSGFAAFEQLPAWSEDMVFMGGPGFVGPGRTAETTVYLEPGTYALECYVKTDGTFHTTHGMITGFTVTGEPSGAREPRAQLDLTISAEEGITLDGSLRPGKQTIAVHFEDQIVHGNGAGHDVHLARIDGGTDLEDLATWMNWVVGLQDPAPADFLGGAHDMPAGSTAYITVSLLPGRYAFIAEVDSPDEKDMLQTFTIPQGSVSR